MKILCEMLGCEDPVIQVGELDTPDDSWWHIDSLKDEENGVLACDSCWQEYENLRAYRPGDHETWVEHSIMERDGKCSCIFYDRWIGIGSPSTERDIIRDGVAILALQVAALAESDDEFELIVADQGLSYVAKRLLNEAVRRWMNS